MVHKGISLSLAGISVKEEETIKNFKGKKLPICVLNMLLAEEYVLEEINSITVWPC